MSLDPGAPFPATDAHDAASTHGRHLPYAYLLVALAWGLALAAGALLADWTILPMLHKPSALAHWLDSSTRGSDLLGIALWIGVSIVALVVPMIPMALANSLLVPSYAQLRAHDARPPVVYLRPFDEDSESTTQSISVGDMTYTESLPTSRHLESLAALGPMVSIAPPGLGTRMGLYATSGPAHHAVDDAVWQAEVEALVAAAQWVIFVVGDTPGIEWELALLRQRADPQRLLLYLPPRTNAAWTTRGQERRELERVAPALARVAQAFGCAVPEPLPSPLYFVGFASDWSVRLARTDGVMARWWWDDHQRLRAAVYDQLRQFVPALPAEAGTQDHALGEARFARNTRWVVFALAVLCGLGLRLSVDTYDPRCADTRAGRVCSYD